MVDTRAIGSDANQVHYVGVIPNRSDKVCLDAHRIKHISARRREEGLRILTFAENEAENEEDGGCEAATRGRRRQKREETCKRQLDSHHFHHRIQSDLVR